MRIIDGKNPLDRTSIHPESYDAAKKLLDIMGFNLRNLQLYLQQSREIHQVF